MTTEEIKNLLHESIENIDDENFLEAIRIIIEPKCKTPSTLSISEKHRDVLKVREKQIEAGEFYTNEEVKKICEEWLKK